MCFNYSQPTNADRVRLLGGPDSMAGGAGQQLNDRQAYLQYREQGGDLPYGEWRASQQQGMR
jgi:hypothetical protein